MLDSATWKLAGTGKRVIRYGVMSEVSQMTFYRHHVTQQLKIIYTQTRTEPKSR